MHFNSADSSVVPDTLNYIFLKRTRCSRSKPRSPVISANYSPSFAFYSPIRKPSSGSCCCRHFEMLFHKFHHFQYCLNTESRITVHCFSVNSVIGTAILTLRRLMSYIYGAPILDVSRSHTTTQTQSVGLLWTSDQLVAETST